MSICIDRVCNNAYKLMGCGEHIIPLDPRRWISTYDLDGHPVVFSNIEILRLIACMADYELRCGFISLSDSYITCSGDYGFVSISSKSELVNALINGTTIYSLLSVFTSKYSTEDDRFDGMELEREGRRCIQRIYDSLYTGPKSSSRAYELIHTEIRHLLSCI